MYGYAALDPNGPRDHPFWNPDLPLEDRLQNLMELLTLEEKIKFLYHIADDIPRLNIRHYYHGNEALHGVVRPGTATVFPQAIAFGATWNPELIFKVATAISDEARAKHHNEPDGSGHSNGLLTFWSPTVNMARDPRWGRTPETYGEDPFLTAKIGVQFVKGLQGEDSKYLKVVSTPKHYAGNNEDHNRNKCKPNINMRDLREYYVPQFKALITEGKAYSIMSAYNAIFDIPVSASRFMMWELLREEWGFNGYTVTDCSAISNMMPWQHRYVWSFKKACAEAINAGIDLECGHLYKKGHLLAAVNAGLVSQETINRATYNVLKAYFKLGRFDPQERVPYSKIPLSVVGCEKHSNLALQVAQESMILLKNAEVNGKKLLPLPAETSKKIVIIGPNAEICQFGDYSGVPHNHPISPVEGIRNKYKNAQITVVPWIWPGQQKKYCPIPSKNLRPTVDCQKYEGLKRTLYSQPDFKGNTKIGVDGEINFNWKQNAPDASISNAFTSNSIEALEKFSIEWDGFICPDISGEYEIMLDAQGNQPGDAATWTLNNQLMPPKTKISFEAGQTYSIKIRFRYAGLKSSIKLQWRLPKTSSDQQYMREIAAVKQADFVFACLGLGRQFEREGHDKKDLNLPKDQRKLMQSIWNLNSNIVVLMISGSPLGFTDVAKKVPAILQCWYPGERGGEAIADILCGAVNPSGKLPVTFYHSAKDIPPFNEYDITKGKTYWYFDKPCLYPFGYGLSYTSFSYEKTEISKSSVQINPTESFTVTVTIKNTGTLSGTEVVQVYLKYLSASGSKRAAEKLPLSQLKGFARVELKPNEVKIISIPLFLKDMEFYDVATRSYIILPGKVELQVGTSSAEIFHTHQIEFTR
jgi:beta-glucosidase